MGRYGPGLLYWLREGMDDPWIWLAVGIAGTLAALTPLWLRARQRSLAARALDQLDTLSTWPPEPMRVLDVHERLALQALNRALPHHLILAAVPLAGFLNVPRRHSYTEWLKRVGHLSVDLMVCDSSSQVVAVVLLRKPNDTAKRLRRAERIVRVLEAARVRVLVWPAAALPSPDEIRESLRPTPRAAPLPGSPVSAPADALAGREITLNTPARHGPAHGLGLPVPLVVERHPNTTPEAARETPPSTWFDDLDPTQDSGPLRPGSV